MIVDVIGKTLQGGMMEDLLELKQSTKDLLSKGTYFQKHVYKLNLFLEILNEYWYVRGDVLEEMYSLRSKFVEKAEAAQAKRERETNTHRYHAKGNNSYERYVAGLEQRI